MVPIPHYKISYAQNNEDRIIAGILKSVKEGFYVDVGANHPEQDSVTKIFYDSGWSGINVEPRQELHEALSEKRSRDINLKVGVASQSGLLRFRSYDVLDGLSTFSQQSKKMVGTTLPAASFSDSTVDVLSLDEILNEHRPSGDIHFLKVDVEGMELEVLLGNDWGRFRPWVLCLERGQDAGRQAAIHSLLEASKYLHIFFDGINDYWIAQEHFDLWEDFSYARDVIMNGVCINYIFVRCMTELCEQIPARDA
jgi:FkbM family methyltransferase